MKWNEQFWHLVRIRAVRIHLFFENGDTQLMRVIQTHKFVRIMAQKWPELRLNSDEFVGLNNAHQLRIAGVQKKGWILTALILARDLEDI